MSRGWVEGEIVFVAVSETMRLEAKRVMSQLKIELPIIVSNMQSIAEDLSAYPNAAIEASRSGQFGSGFSVVASEIRKLAVESQQQVNDIDRTLQVVLRDTSDIVSHIEHMAHFTSKQYDNSEAITDVLRGIEDSGKTLVQFAQEK